LFQLSTITDFFPLTEYFNWILCENIRKLAAWKNINSDEKSLQTFMAEAFWSLPQLREEPVRNRRSAWNSVEARKF
jgi:hypothetical protein